MRVNVENFDLDYTKARAPYVRVADRKTSVHDGIIIKYDVRFKQPNKEHMDMPNLYSLGHLTAELIRNHVGCIVDWSPMGCQAGFYLTVLNHESCENILDVLEATIKDALEAIEVSASNEV